MQRCPRPREQCRRALLAAAVTAALVALPAVSPDGSVAAGRRPAQHAAQLGVGAPGSAARSASPPPRQGYFSQQPVGAWRSLRGSAACRLAVHRSSWEPRPDNATSNSTMPNATAVRNALSRRPRNTGGGYDSRWDGWLLARVDGQFTGTTDEIFQWAACKWGLSDNLLRAVAVRESTWYQYEVYRSARCVSNWGCGDLHSRRTAATDVYCSRISAAGHDYEADYGVGLCPKTFSIAGVMAWQAPSWGRMRSNQNGTFPFSRNSTAYALDYLGGSLRGCFEGWQRWLDNTGTQDYRPGDMWGCVGSWYSGSWHDAAGEGYSSRVRAELANRTWLAAGWARVRPACSARWGCPTGWSGYS
jgi:hypothetical protein